MIPPGDKTASLLVVPACCGLTPLYPFFYPNLLLKPSLHKTRLISVLPSPSPAPNSCTLNEPLKPASSLLVCLHAQDAECSV